MKLLTSSSVAALVLAGVFAGGAAHARDQIRIVGSSTVYPFTTAVAEQFGKAGKFRTPVVESTGTGGGFKLFCAGVGEGHPDVTNASRAITKSEFDDCAKNGVKEIVELKVGFDGLTISNSKAGASPALTKSQIFLALAKQVPGPDGKLIANPYKAWNEIDPSLPAQKIEVLGPPPTSGTRDSFLELVMEKGAEGVPVMAALKKADAKAFGAAWKALREDGAWIDAGENDNLIVQKLETNPNAFGVFGYSFLEENTAKVKGISVNGVAPNYDTIASGKYSVARPLFVYIKKQHVGQVPGLKEFVDEYASMKATGEDGYLADKGLVPLPAADLSKAQGAAKAMQTIAQPTS